MSSTRQPEEHLVRDLLAGHSAAFSILYDAYSPALFGVLLRLVKDQERAEDLLQDVFIKIWMQIHSYNAKHGRLFTWLLAITRNVAMDEFRSRKIKLSAIPYLKWQADELCYSLIGEVQLYQSVVRHLEPKYRIVIELVYYHSFSGEEVAKKLKLPLGTVKTRHRTALQQLKNLFSQDINYYHRV